MGVIDPRFNNAAVLIFKSLDIDQRAPRLLGNVFAGPY